MSNIKLENVKIGDIKEYENNAKLHPEEQVNKIVDSIVNFGYNDPIAIDEDNVVIEGHGRLMAMRQLHSDKEYEIQILRLTGLDEGQKVAYRIAHNKLNMDTGFDLKGLGKEFNFLEGTDFFNSSGFSTKEMTEVWENKDKVEPSSELIAEDSKKIISHTCPDCGHNWDEEIRKKK